MMLTRVAFLLFLCLADADQVDFKKTAAHQIGHTLGLRHSNLPNTLMNPWTDLQSFSVTDAEKTQLSKLYNEGK